MPALKKIAFQEISINGKLLVLDQTLNRCEISHRSGRHYLSITVTQEMSLDVDVQLSLVEYLYGKWDQEARENTFQIMDFNITMTSIPIWLKSYSIESTRCAHNIIFTMKLRSSQANYNGFTSFLQSILTTSQCASLENPEALNLWKRRCAPLPHHKVNTVKLCTPNFQDFSKEDLLRLKDDKKWLSDSHVTLILQDWFLVCAQRNTWGNLKIYLTDTFFWTHLSSDPESYGDRYRKRTGLLEYDFVVMPMFGSNHWRLGIIEKPTEFLQGNTVLHILDSFRIDSLAVKEAKELQIILLKHFDGEAFKEGRITTNVAKVPQQRNDKDCGCFMIYFAKKFLSDPAATMALIKTPFPSDAGLVAWGLKTHDLTFVRREIRTLLFQYVSKGKAVVEFK